MTSDCAGPSYIAFFLSKAGDIVQQEVLFLHITTGVENGDDFTRCYSLIRLQPGTALIHERCTVTWDRHTANWRSRSKRVV
jgi:hypothetical protein